MHQKSIQPNSHYAHIIHLRIAILPIKKKLFHLMQLFIHRQFGGLVYDFPQILFVDLLHLFTANLGLVSIGKQVDSISGEVTHFVEPKMFTAKGYVGPNWTF